MSQPDYALDQFVADLQTAAANINDTKALLKHLKPKVEALAQSPDLLARVDKTIDAAQGFSFNLLHEEPDHSLAVSLFSWSPRFATPVHDHRTWGIVVGVIGDEVNVFYRRNDDGQTDGHAELSQLSEISLKPGEALLLMPDIIHAVRNDSDEVSVSLHVYGKHINHTGRSRYDADKQTIAPWVVKQANSNI
jgi:predicted metal-dependent enzyme (double-stranded beta helix superfamily)